MEEWTGKILRVDLTAREFAFEDMDPAMEKDIASRIPLLVLKAEKMKVHSFSPHSTVLIANS